jgi:Papain family cysteine protease
LTLIALHFIFSSETVKEYRTQTCPAGGGGHSGDAVEGSNTFSRYGKIDGYGYSTDKCVCYTDGSGCDCDDQNENYAIRNVASYGPAVVCLDASLWQDYTSGIITSESGCSSGFMDVNHCAQVVGYAYSTDTTDATSNSRDLESNSNDKSDSKSRSGSGEDRNGYWIVRNQWSSYWGMNGYAYVAMGDNTCGILNDMMQAYT